MCLAGLANAASHLIAAFILHTTICALCAVHVVILRHANRSRLKEPEWGLRWFCVMNHSVVTLYGFLLFEKQYSIYRKWGWLAFSYHRSSAYCLDGIVLEFLWPYQYGTLNKTCIMKTAATRSIWMREMSQILAQWRATVADGMGESVSSRDELRDRFPIPSSWL